MSYILDALRRADAERERDPARGIHAQPAAGAPAAARAQIPGWAWPLAALAVAGALVFAWQRPGQEPAAPQVAVTAVPPPAAPAVAASPAVAAPTVVAVADVVSPPPPAMPPKPRVERARPAAVAAATPHAPAAPAKAAGTAVAASTTSPNTAAPAPVPAAAPATAPAPAAAPAAAGNAAQPGAFATAKLAPGAAAPVATAAGNRVFNPAELPADVQGALPKLAITGGVYSDNAAQRMLIVGGQLVKEGAELAPGVVLDQIRSRSAVLRFRGYRYGVSY